MLGIEQKKGNDEKLCGRMIAYARILPTPDNEESDSPFGDMIKNGLLTLEGDFRKFNPTVPSRQKRNRVMDERLNELLETMEENGVELPVEQRRSENPQFTLDYHLPKASWDDNGKARWPSKYDNSAAHANYFWAKASSPESTVTVKVTDGFGREYTEVVERPKAFGKLMR